MVYHLQVSNYYYKFSSLVLNIHVQYVEYNIMASPEQEEPDMQQSVLYCSGSCTFPFFWLSKHQKVSHFSNNNGQSYVCDV